jgi:L-fuculose-phosphate aldolase
MSASAPQSEAHLRRDLVRYSLQMHEAGWVANHDGNLSARVGEAGEAARFVCTPTAFSKRDVTLDDLLVVDDKGQRLGGRAKPFSELNLHLGVYRLRAEVRAVVHAHPPYATAWGAAQRPLPHPFLPEAVVSLGAHIPLVPLSAPGQPALDALAPWIRRCDAVVIAGNGALAWGPTLELAYLRLELVEHIAKIAHQAEALGGARPLDEALVRSLVEKRVAAGLACPEEEGARRPTDDPALAAALARVRAAFPSAPEAELRRLAAEAMARAKP